MKEFKLDDFLQFLAQYDFELKLGFYIVSAIFLILVAVYFVRKKMVPPAAAPRIPAASAKAPAAPKPAQKVSQEPPASRRPSVAEAAPAVRQDIPQEPEFWEDFVVDDEATKVLPTAAATPSRDIPQESASRQDFTVPNKIATTPPKTSATAAALPHIPQESVLRRHYLTHIRYMIEATTFPRPTESVLRRHYEQLVGSIMDACVSDRAELEKLLRRYDEHRKSAIS